MDLPSFLWLWKIAAWSMGLSLLAYFLLAISGLRLRRFRQSAQDCSPAWRSGHLFLGGSFVVLILLLLSVGIIGTLGHFGNLGHSPHLWAGLTVVTLALSSAASALQIRRGYESARAVHIALNIGLFFGLSWVGWSGWLVVQKYL